MSRRQRRTSIEFFSGTSPSDSYESEVDYGVLVGNIPLTLTSVSAEVRLLGFGAHVTVVQSYKNILINNNNNNQNNSSAPREARFLLPIDDTACAVSYFEISIDGERKVAFIEENGKSANANDSKITSRTSLYEKTDKDIFSISVGSISHEAVNIEVTIKYVQDLAEKISIVDDERETLFLIPSVLLRGTNQSESLKNCSITLNAVMSENIKSATLISPTTEREVSVDVTENSAKINFTATQMKGDFKVSIKENIVKDQPIQAVMEIGQEHVIVSCSVYADTTKDFDINKVNPEVIFLLDCSGSMSGSKITCLKDAMQLFIRSLPVKSWFNIVTFESKFHSLFSESVQLNEETFATAVDFFGTLAASGGTNLHTPLTHVVKQTKSTSASCRQIIILTDGEVDNPEAVLEIAKENSEVNKYFCFGIGGDVKKEYLKKLAKTSDGGRAAFVSDSRTMDSKVAHYLEKAIQPSIGGVTLSIPGEGHKATVAPHRIDSMIHQQSKTIFAFIPSVAELPNELLVTANSDNGKLEWRVPIKRRHESSSTQNLFGCLFGRAMIRDYEKGKSSYHKNGKLMEEFQQDFINHEIVSVSTKWGIMSSLTSLVCFSKSNSGPAADSMDIGMEDIDEDRGRARSRSPSRKGRYSSVSRSRSSSPDGTWKPRRRSVSPTHWNSSSSVTSPRKNLRRRSSSPDSVTDSDSDSGSPSPVRRSRSRSPSPVRNLRSRSRSPSPRPSHRMASRSPPRRSRRTASRSPPRRLKSLNSNNNNNNNNVLDEEGQFRMLVKLQSIDGSWKGSPSMLEGAGINSKKAFKLLDKLAADKNLVETVFTTLLAIRILETNFASRSKSWNLLVKKARTFIDGSSLPSEVLASINQIVEDVFTESQTQSSEPVEEVKKERTPEEEEQRRVKKEKKRQAKEKKERQDSKPDDEPNPKKKQCIIS